MSTLIVYSDTSDGVVGSYNETTYSPARSGTGSNRYADSSELNMGVGQSLDTEEPPDIYGVSESFLGFDTSAIGDTDVISSATLTLTSDADSSAVNFTIEARLYDWGPTLTTTDFVPGDDLSGDTLLASYPTASGWTPGTSYNFTSESAFAANINKTGTTRMCLSSSRTRVSNEPGGSAEFIWARSADYTGTTSDPKLTIEYTSFEWDGPGPSIDAVIRREQAGSLSSYAVIYREQTGSLTADAVIFRTQAGSFAAEAALSVLQSGSLAADAVVLRAQTASLFADAVIRGTQSGSAQADAIRLRTFWFGSEEAGF